MSSDPSSNGVLPGDREAATTHNAPAGEAVMGRANGSEPSVIVSGDDGEPSPAAPAPLHPRKNGPETTQLAATMARDPRFADRPRDHLEAVARDARDAKPGFTAERLAARAAAVASGGGPQLTVQAPAPPRPVRAADATPTPTSKGEVDKVPTDGFGVWDLLGVLMLAGVVVLVIFVIAKYGL